MEPENNARQRCHNVHLDESRCISNWRMALHAKLEIFQKQIAFRFLQFQSDIYFICHMVFLTFSNICPLWGAPAAWLKNLFLSRTSDRSHSLQAWVSTRTKKKSQQKWTSTGGYHMSGPCKVYVRGCPPQNHGLIWHCSSISGTLRWWFKFMDRFLSIKKGISPTTMGNYSCFTMAKLRQITYGNLFN